MDRLRLTINDELAHHLFDMCWRLWRVNSSLSDYQYAAFICMRHQCPDKLCCCVSVTILVTDAIWEIVVHFVIVTAAIPWIQQHIICTVWWQHSCRYNVQVTVE